MKKKSLNESENNNAVENEENEDEEKESLDEQLSEDVNAGAKEKDTNVDDVDDVIICKHCGEEINQTMLIGLSLICPLCGKPQNGHPKDPVVNPYDKVMIVCKHCGEKIDQATLRGISLLCPLCQKPQNGAPHFST